MPNVVVYVVTNWQDLPNKSTAINAQRLNHIETGIKNVTDWINTLNADAGKVLSAEAFTATLKSKIDGIEEHANYYVLPTASESTKGGVKVDGVTIVIDENGVISGAESSAPLTETQMNTLLNLIPT